MLVGGGTKSVEISNEDPIPVEGTVELGSTTITAIQNAVDAANNTVESSLAVIADQLNDILTEIMQKLEAGEDVGLTEDAITALATAIATLFNYPTDYPDAGTHTKLDTLLSQTDSLETLLAHLTDATQKTLLTNGTNIADVTAGDAGNNAQIVSPASKNVNFTTTGPVNTVLVGPIDISNFSSFVVDMNTFSGTGSPAWRMQLSGDGSTWRTLAYEVTNNPNGAPTTTDGTSTGSVGGPLQNERYFRIIQSAGTSTSVSGTVRFSSDNWTPRSIYASLVGTPAVASQQSGTYTVQPGNTQNTTPWFVEERNSYSHLAANATTTIKSGAGKLHSITINTLGVADTITVYDNTAGSGTVIAVINAAVSQQTLLYDVVFSTGLTVVIAGTTAPDITVAYR